MTQNEALAELLHRPISTQVCINISKESAELLREFILTRIRTEKHDDYAHIERESKEEIFERGLNF